MAVTKRKGRGGKVAYSAEVFVAGVRVAFRTFSGKTAAMSWHDETKRRYEQGRGEAGNMTLANVIQSYRERELRTKATPTRRRREGRFKLIEQAPIAEVKMVDFCGGTVESFVDWLTAHAAAKTKTRKSFREEVKTLTLVLNFFRECYDPQFVTPVTKGHRRRALYKGAVPKKAKDFYLPAEHARRWLGVLCGHATPVFGRLAKTQVTLGLRVGEAVAICDDAIDFAPREGAPHGTLTVKRTMEWRNEDGTRCRRIADRVKTEESRRSLPLPREIADILRQSLSEQPQVVYKTEAGHMVRPAFHMPSGALLEEDTIRRAYDRAFKAAGLPWTGSHICRDTNGTLPLGEGVSLEEIRVNHGHSSVVETEGYAKVHAMVKNRVPETVARLLFRSDGKNPVENHVETKS